MKIHQVYIGNQDFFDNVVSVHLSEEMANVKNIQDAEYKLWTEDDIINLLKNNYDERLLNAYHKIRPNTFKSDIARAALLDTFGGIYVDIGHEFFNYQILKDLTETNDMVVFSDINEEWFTNMVGYHGSIQSALMYSSGSNIFLKSVLEEITKNVENNFYGTSPWDATSVTRFGKVFEKTNIDFKYVRGRLEKTESGRNHYFVDGTSESIAGHKHPEKSGIFHGSGMSYVELWNNHMLYN
jgi:hypothetical protein